MQVAQAPPPQPAEAAPHADGAPAAATTNLALCQQPAETVATAPITQTITTNNAVWGRDDNATTPATANIAAAASCVGATARRTRRTTSPERGRDSVHPPSAAVAAAAHKQPTAAKSMRPTLRVAARGALAGRELSRRCRGGAGGR